MANLTFNIRTLGCKTNQYETQAIRERLLQSGFTESTDPKSTGIFIINTCSVTHRAEASCRNALRQALKANPDSTVVITGCSVDLKRDWAKTISSSALLISNSQKHLLVDRLLERLHIDGKAGEMTGTNIFALGISSFERHTRAFIKIQDGCDNFCSYCTIPFARGKPRSRPLADILEEANRLAQNGHKELVLTGINIGKYNYDSLTLADIAEKVSLVNGVKRLRLGSVEPDEVTDQLLDIIQTSKIICPHLHLPLQSGDDSILKAMNRHYTLSDFFSTLDRIRSTLPNPAITTDLIVGFPGEGEREFATTMETCRRSAFSRMHIFTYSARPGTESFSHKQTEPDRVIGERHRCISDLADEMAVEYATNLIGSSEMVLVEEQDGGIMTGYTDTYIKAKFAGNDELLNRLTTIKITKADKDGVFGEIA